MAVYPSFIACARQAIEPVQQANPEWVRLDGATSGGNRHAFAAFQYRGDTWVIHSDSHFEPLLIAAGAAAEGMDPFEVRSTSQGVRLDLRAELQAVKADPKHRHLYIYRRP